MPYAVGRLRAVRPPTADSAALVSRRGLADVVLPPPRRLPVGGRRRWGLGRSGGGKSAPCAGIRAIPHLQQVLLRFIYAFVEMLVRGVPKRPSRHSHSNLLHCSSAA